ncbi:hypothetical protein DFH09DRAFT_1108424 [Mycena vulgaris]|nr:hypothetical protein DFH09DRAFT_1108424 [Mycena vulgaris]
MFQVRARKEVGKAARAPAARWTAGGQRAAIHPLPNPTAPNARVRHEEEGGVGVGRCGRCVVRAQHGREHVHAERTSARRRAMRKRGVRGVLAAIEEVRAVGPRRAEGHTASTYTSWTTRRALSGRWTSCIVDLGSRVVNVRRWDRCERREWERGRGAHGVCARSYTASSREGAMRETGILHATWRGVSIRERGAGDGDGGGAQDGSRRRAGKKSLAGTRGRGMRCGRWGIRTCARVREPIVRRSASASYFLRVGAQDGDMEEPEESHEYGYVLKGDRKRGGNATMEHCGKTRRTALPLRLLWPVPNTSRRAKGGLTGVLGGEKSTSGTRLTSGNTIWLHRHAISELDALFLRETELDG